MVFGRGLVGLNSRIVPEYSFLDARGLGAYEGRGLAAVNEVSDFEPSCSN